MAISKESTQVIRDGMAVLREQRKAAAGKVKETQDEIDNLKKRLDQQKAHVDAIDASIAKMKTDIGEV